MTALPASAQGLQAPASYSGFVDALRGFALVGVCVVNMTFYDSATHGPLTPPAGFEAAAAFAVSLLFEGKFFLLFSALFGFGFAAQMERAPQGKGMGAAYARRLGGLGVLGVLHAVLLFPGDILLTYALLGAALWRVRHWPDRRLLKLALIWAAAAAILLGLMGLAFAVLDGRGRLDAAARTAQDANAAVQAYRGSAGQALGRRLEDWGFALLTLPFSQWPLTFAAMCCGVVAHRRGLLAAPERLEALLRPRLPLLLAGAVAGNLAWAASPWLPPALQALAYVGLVAGSPCLSALYALALAAAWRGAGQRVVQAFAPAGRTSLTNYLGQSVAANVLLMGWGLGLYGQLGRPALLLAALAIASGLVALSHLWLRRFSIGPAEWALRSWTALRWQPLRRR